MKNVVKILKITATCFLVYSVVFLFSLLLVKTDRLIAETKKSEEFIIYPRNVEITGNKRVSREEILIVAGLDRPRGFFDVSESKLELYIRTNRWIKNLVVKKMFPDAIKILIEEYKPAIIVNSKEKKNGGSHVFSLWFADEDGIVFKKTFPQETGRELPFFYLDYDMIKESEKQHVVQKAVTISKEWKKGGKLCLLHGIQYDMIKGYWIDCEYEDKRSSRVYLGYLKNNASKELKEMRELFFNTAGKLQKKNLFAGEYSFDERDGSKRIIVGKLTQKNSKGE